MTGAPHVAVVGGGLAGVSAALACADAGARVSLFEARGVLGGATWSTEKRATMRRYGRIRSSRSPYGTPCSTSGAGSGSWTWSRNIC